MAVGRNTNVVDSIRKMLLDKSTADATAQIHGKMLRPSLMALVSDAREAEQMAQAKQSQGASSGAGQGQSTPRPVKINADNPGGGLGADVVAGLTGNTQVLGDMHVVDQETPSGDGRTLTRTSTQTGREPYFSGNGALGIGTALGRLVTGNENFGSREVTSTRSEEVENPEWVRRTKADTFNTAEAMFRLNNGDMPAGEYSTGLSETMKKYNPMEKQRIMSEAKSMSSNLVAAQLNDDRNASKTLTLAALQGDASLSPEISSAMFQYMRSRSEDETSQATARLRSILMKGETYKAKKTAEEKTALINDLTWKSKLLQLEADQRAGVKGTIEHQRFLAQSQQDTIMSMLGLNGTMTEPGTTDAIRGMRDKNGNIIIDESNYAMLENIQMNQFRLGVPVSTVSHEGWFGGNVSALATTKVENFSPQEYIHEMDILQGEIEGDVESAAYNLTKDGRFTLVPEDGFLRGGKEDGNEQEKAVWALGNVFPASTDEEFGLVPTKGHRDITVNTLTQRAHTMKVINDHNSVDAEGKQVKKYTPSIWDMERQYVGENNWFNLPANAIRPEQGPLLTTGGLTPPAPTPPAAKLDAGGRAGKVSGAWIRGGAEAIAPYMRAMNQLPGQVWQGLNTVGQPGVEFLKSFGQEVSKPEER